MKKLVGRYFPLFLILGLLATLTPQASERKESFGNLFGEFAKWYYQFRFVKQTPESWQEMDAVLHRASRLSKEELITRAIRTMRH